MSDPTDFISSEEPTPSSWRRSREASLAGAGVHTTAMTAALTVVAAAGIATAVARSSSSGTQPAALIPANAFAVATADLSLPGGQSDALETMIGRFPGAHLVGSGSIRDRVLRTLVHSADASIDYDRDVKPWLGDHIAIAGWVHDSKPEMEILIQSTDDASARSHISQIANGDAHVTMHDGYAVIGNSQQAVDDAIAAADKSSLASSGTYNDDVAALPDNEAITAWFNGPAAKDLLSSLMPGGAPGVMPFPGTLAFGSGLGQLLKSRIALGVHVTDTVAELDVRSVGGTATKAAPSTMLTTLPGGTVGALELGDPGGVVDAATPLIRFFGSFAAEASTSCGFASSGTSLTRRQLRRLLEHRIPPGAPHRRRLIRQLLASQAGKAATGGSCTTTPPQPTDPLAAIQQAIGISFPDDVKTVLGDRAVVVFGGLELAGLPDVAIRSHPTDLSAAQSLANTLSSHVAGSTPLNIDVSTAGDDLVLATSPAYGKEVATGGNLGGQAQAKTALDGIPDSVSFAAYLDLSRVWPLLGSDVPDGIKHLRAVGLWAANNGDVQTAQLRVVFG